MASTKVKFVSRKISKVRWIPKSSTTFITGSYNDQDNYLTLWTLPSVTPGENENFENGFEDIEPMSVCNKPFSGDVTDLKVVSEELVFASSSKGSIYGYKLTDDELQPLHLWENVHSFNNNSASTTAISVKGHSLASVGEDGKLCIFNISTQKKVMEIEDSHLCSLTCVCHQRHQEIVAGNRLGYLKFWDMRSPIEKPRTLLVPSRQLVTVTCINTHPTQSHIVATGYEDGSICVWDMRELKRPVTMLQAHTAALTELLFHPINPDFLYTSSIDGSLWQWNSSNLKNNLPVFNPNIESEMDQDLIKGNPWFNCDANRHKLEVIELFSNSWSCVNSLDINDSILLWGTDSEALYTLNGIMV